LLGRGPYGIWERAEDGSREGEIVREGVVSR
jgi:hypothetical protein